MLEDKISKILEDDNLDMINYKIRVIENTDIVKIIKRLFSIKLTSVKSYSILTETFDVLKRCRGGLTIINYILDELKDNQSFIEIFRLIIKVSQSSNVTSIPEYDTIYKIFLKDRILALKRNDLRPFHYYSGYLEDYYDEFIENYQIRKALISELKQSCEFWSIPELDIHSMLFCRTVNLLKMVVKCSTSCKSITEHIDMKEVEDEDSYITNYKNLAIERIMNKLEKVED